MLPLPHPLFFPTRPLQYLMEGSYNKVFLAKGNIPAESYTFFIDILLDTIRCVGARAPRSVERAWTPESDSSVFESHSGHL